MIPNIGLCSGNVFKVTILEHALLNVVSNGQNGVRYGGFEWKLLTTIAKTLNFTFDIHRGVNGHYGAMLPNKSWTGIIGRLHNMEADIGIAGLVDNFSRRKVVDFSEPYIMDTLNFFVGVEPPARLKSVLFLSPFENEIWLLLLACFVFLISIIHLFQKIDGKIGSNPKKMLDKQGLFLILFGICFRQGVDVPGIGIRSCILVASWIISCTFLTTSYGGALTVSTGVSTRHCTDTLEELAVLFKSGSMKFFIPEHFSLINVIETMPALPYGDIFRQAILSRPTDLKRDYQEVEERQITLIEGLQNMPISLKNNGFTESTIRPVKEPFCTMCKAIAFRKNLTCQRSINYVIVTLRETGILKQWMEEVMLTIMLQRMKDETWEPPLYIKISDLRSTSILLVSGLVISSCVLLLERYSKFSRQATPEKKIRQKVYRVRRSFLEVKSPYS